MNKKIILLITAVIPLLFIPVFAQELDQNDSTYIIPTKKLYFKFFVSEELEYNAIGGSVVIDGKWEKINPDSIKVLDVSDDLKKAWIVGTSEESKHELFFTYILETDKPSRMGLWMYDGQEVSKYLDTFEIIEIH